MNVSLQKPFSRWARRGAASTTLTSLVLVAVVLINVIASMAGERTNLKIDLTENNAFGLSQGTLDYLTSVEQSVEIVICNNQLAFSGQNEYFAQADRVIGQCAMGSKKIQVTYVDLVQDPTFQTRYPQYQLEPNDIVVQCGDRSKLLDAFDLYNLEYSYYGYGIESSKAEETMTSTIMALTSDQELLVSVLSGHGESGSSGLESLLSTNNLTVLPQSLVTEDISSQAKLAIISAPTRDYDTEMLEKLDRYLAQGGTLFYLADASQPSLPHLEAYLASKGITVGTGVVFETDQNRIFNYNSYFPVVNYAEDIYSTGLKNQQLVSALPYSRPLTLTKSGDGSYTLTSLLEFSATSGVVPVDADENWQPAQGDLGVQTGMALSTLSGGGRVIVSGSVALVDESLLTSTSVSNSTFLMNMVNDITEREETFSVEPKTLGGETLTMTTGQVNMVGLTFIVVLPMILVLLGIFTWLSRKNR